MIIRQSTARTILVGPVLDSTGAAKTDEVVGNIKVTKNGTVGAADGSATLVHDHAGKYRLALTANDCDTVGVLEISLNSGTNDMAVKACNVIEQPIWDALFADGATGLLPANVTQIGGDTQSATDLKDFADAGYDPSTNKLTGAVELDSAVRVKLDATQPDYAPATVAALAAAKTILDKIDTGLVQDGLVYQFTANMLELGPSGGGGGGDATLAKQEEILTQLDVIQTKTDLIGTAAGATTLLAAAVLEPGTITSFPETLTIGDSYTEQNGRSIQIPIVDTDGNPISSTGSLDFANASVTFTLQRSGETDSTRVITGSASFVDPPGTGTGAGAPYAVIEIPASETAKGLKKYKYSGILTFTWTGTGTDVMSFETDTVTFDN